MTARSATAEMIPAVYPGDRVRVHITRDGKLYDDSHKLGGVWLVMGLRGFRATIGRPGFVESWKVDVRLLSTTTDALPEPPATDFPTSVPCGALVQFTPEHARRAKCSPDDLWVVLADKFDRVNVARLGGDDNRYTRAPRAMLARVVPVEEVASILAK
jgi:hypothetical protein